MCLCVHSCACVCEVRGVSLLCCAGFHRLRRRACRRRDGLWQQQHVELRHHQLRSVCRGAVLLQGVIVVSVVYVCGLPALCHRRHHHCATDGITTVPSMLSPCSRWCAAGLSLLPVFAVRADRRQRWARQLGSTRHVLPHELLPPRLPAGRIRGPVPAEAHLVQVSVRGRQDRHPQVGWLASSCRVHICVV